ncbi:type II toxin-antitoxin system prevent-host-death family antitoxin [Thalassospira sp. HF15]|uniref:type II toxin-antitoxin system Phd/YefM family antitoxin n=1 Tax=Thalassospira sp. HF15 TaxID=2722755 RepID=UPI00142F5D5A|nr:type II toxin-antitoxin system prevent-host-death family antitoxin [Thalassospira sp. HF15]NIY76910.1 type II toxin-antitoxin system prevent-host-death family antitoxin [Thalassospira sp. HF15]
MGIVNIHEAKTHLSRLIARVMNGEQLVIAKAGKPVVQMSPYQESQVVPKRIGFLKDEKILIPEDFDRMGQDEIEEMFGVG